MPRASVKTSDLVIAHAPSVPTRVRRAPAAAGMLLDRVAWRDAGVVWLSQHVLLLLITYVGRTLLVTQTSNVRGAATTTWQNVFGNWLAWDGYLYSRIAATGYRGGGAPAFSPLLPLLERALSAPFGLNPEIAGVVIANVAGLGAFGLFRVLSEREFGRETAQRALLYLAVFPTAFFLAAPYTESLFLLLSIGAFLAMRQGQWPLAGALAALATLTRQTGILLLVPLLVAYGEQYWARRSALRLPQYLAMLSGVALPCIALGGFDLYLYSRYGTFFATSRAEEQIWGRSLGVPGIGIARAGGALLRLGYNPNFFQVHILLDIAFTLAFIALTIATWRRLPLSYTLYTGALLLAVLAMPLHNWYALMSNMRLMLSAFPLFLLLSQWGKSQQVERLILIMSLPLLTLLALIFVMGGWVA
jgi:hypothetical protein